jgi:hypothetical protein
LGETAAFFVLSVYPLNLLPHALNLLSQGIRQTGELLIGVVG